MFEKGKEEIVKAGGSETIVGASVKLKGSLRSDGNMLIEGAVNGDLKTKGSVKIGESANVVANIQANDIVVSGSVQGNIVAKERLEITESGKVIGDIVTNVLSIAPGAVFSGKCEMSDHQKQDAKPVIEVSEKEEKNK